jgi:hypothetical protein
MDLQLAPGDECGITVVTDKLMTRSKGGAIVVRSVIAYSSGALVVLGVHSRVPLGDHWTTVLTSRDGEALQVGLAFTEDADQVPLSPPLLLPQWDEHMDTYRGIVQAHGGDGDTGFYEIRLWISPRVPDTAFTISAEWPEMDIARTAMTVPMPSDQRCREEIVLLWGAKPTDDPPTRPDA